MAITGMPITAIDPAMAARLTIKPDTAADLNKDTATDSTVAGVVIAITPPEHSNRLFTGAKNPGFRIQIQAHARLDPESWPLWSELKISSANLECASLLALVSRQLRSRPSGRRDLDQVAVKCAALAQVGSFL